MRRAPIWIFALTMTVIGLWAVDWVVAEKARNASIVDEAEWIWAKGSELLRVGPQAFFAIRDFQLETIPEIVTLSIAADEEYVLSLNGRVVGIGRKRVPMTLDSYRVEDLLELGGNRISVELRSPRGGGGCLALLASPAAGTLVKTDRSWRIFRRYELGIARGLLPLDRGEDPWSWGRPRVGRWGNLDRAEERPRWDRLAEGPSALHGRILGEAGMSRRQRLELAEGPIVTFDFGHIVTAFLSLGLSEDKELHALLYTGEERPSNPRQEESAGYVISVSGSPSWQDSTLRRFRFVTLVGIDQKIRALALEAEVTDVEDAPWQSRRPAGVLGIDPPKLGSPMKNEIWRELEGGQGLP